jgi:hypothetical protein
MSVVVAVVLSFSLASVMPGRAVDFNPSVCAGTTFDGSVSQPCLDMMNAFPAPVVSEVPLDGFTLTNYSFWHVTQKTPTNLFDSPGGSIVGQMPGGFNFVRAINQNGDHWIQIEGGQWMSTQDLKFSKPSEFRGVNLLDGLKYPFAWVMDTMYTSDTPGGPQSVDHGRLMRRYDRVNLFAEATDDNGWKWYMVGPNQWIEQRLLARAQRIERPEGVSGRWVAVDLYEQTLVAYEDDTPVFATLVSSGLPGWDTHEGLFRIWARVASDRMAGATGAPDAYALQSVPWVMYFDGSISLHGTYWHDGFGYRHSHGCVNLTISDARYLFKWLGAAKAPLDGNGNVINSVYVYASGQYRTSGSATK